MPAEKGDPRNITATTGSHERAPEWSPDGKSLAYFSDAGGEYALHIRAQDGKAVLLITHYTRILRYIRPDYVHVFVNGRIADEGGPELAEELEANGYDKYLRAAATTAG